MTYETPRDQEYYKQKQQAEYRAQGRIDNWYYAMGFAEVERDADYQHDVTLRRNGTRLKVEEKYRDGDFGDLLVEIIQDVVSNGPGWFYTEKFDRLSYIVMDKNGVPVKIYWIKFDEFRNWFFGYLANKKRVPAILSAKGYGLTLNIPVDWKSIPKGIVQKFDISEDTNA